MASKEFKNLPESQQRILVGKIRNMIEANFKQEEIIKIITDKSKVSKNLVLECIDMVTTAKLVKESK